MASLSKQKDCWRIYFKINGNRKSVRFPCKTPDKEVKHIWCHIEALERSAARGTLIPVATEEWVESIDDQLFDRLAKLGLVSERVDWTLIDWMDHYIDNPAPDVKRGTITTWRQSRQHAAAYFDHDLLMCDLTEQDAHEYRAHLEHEIGLSESTARRRCGQVKQMLEAAVRAGLIDRNVFKSVKTAAPRSDIKDYITLQEADRIMAHLPNAGWRLLFVLARYGGLRVPSEPRTLTWDDIDWERGTITFRSPKTEKYKGGDQRTIPLLDQIRGPLLEVFDQAVEGGDARVLPWMDSPHAAAYRKHLEYAIKRAGMKQWAKLWTTLRANADHDLREHNPEHVVNRWTGHSGRIAERHYQTQLDDRYYRQAIEKMATTTGQHRERQGLSLASANVSGDEQSVDVGVVTGHDGGVGQLIKSSADPARPIS